MSLCLIQRAMREAREQWGTVGTKVTWTTSIFLSWWEGEGKGSSVVGVVCCWGQVIDVVSTKVCLFVCMFVLCQTSSLVTSTSSSFTTIKSSRV